MRSGQMREILRPLRGRGGVGDIPIKPTQELEKHLMRSLLLFLMIDPCLIGSPTLPSP